MARNATPARTDDDLTVGKDVILGDQAIEQAPEYEDPETVSREIVSRILESPDVDSVLSQNTVTHARDILGRPFRILGVRWNRSRFEDGIGVFALLDASFTDTGERTPVTCGSRNVMAQVYRLIELGATDTEVMITEGSETAQGFRPLWLAKA